MFMKNSDLVVLFRALYRSYGHVVISRKSNINYLTVSVSHEQGTCKDRARMIFFFAKTNISLFRSKITVSFPTWNYHKNLRIRSYNHGYFINAVGSSVVTKGILSIQPYYRTERKAFRYSFHLGPCQLFCLCLGR